MPMTNEPNYNAICDMLIQNPDATRQELLELIVGPLPRIVGRSLAEESLSVFFDQYHERAKELAKENPGATNKELAKLLENVVKEDIRQAEAMKLH